MSEQEQEQERAKNALAEISGHYVAEAINRLIQASIQAEVAKLKRQLDDVFFPETQR